MKQKAEITFEEQETVIVRQSNRYLEEFCPRCQEIVRLLTPEVMAALTAVSEREVFRLIESGQVHFIETKRIYACPGCFGNRSVTPLLEIHIQGRSRVED